VGEMYCCGLAPPGVFLPPNLNSCPVLAGVAPPRPRVNFRAAVAVTALLYATALAAVGKISGSTVCLLDLYPARFLLLLFLKRVGARLGFSSEADS